MIDLFRLKTLVKDIYPEIVDIRRYLHKFPEVSSQEYETSRFLKNYARKLGLKVEPVPKTEHSSGTGFIAILDTQKPGKTIGLRTDIDALPIAENPENLKKEKYVVSEHQGVMHACGHDGHMAILLGTMKILVKLKDKLTGKVLFIFEEAEETGAGIHPMIEMLKTKNVEAIYGNHLVSFLKTGEIAVSPGAVTSSTARVKFKVIGKGGHASRPDLAINPIFASSLILNNLASAWNNQLNIEKTITLGITQFHAGNARNVIPEEAYIGGTLRYFDEQIGKDATELIRHVATYVAKANQCTVEFSRDFGPSTPSVVNDEKLSKIVQSLVKALYPNSLKHNVKWFASETFSRYRQLCPIVYTFIGTKNREIGSGAQHHNSRFDIDEESMQYAVGTMTGFALKMLMEYEHH